MRKKGVLKKSFDPSWAARVEIAVIRHFYQRFMSPFLGQACRFHPTCSHYGIAALGKYSFFFANFRILGRILRCNPFCQGGVDYA